MMLVPLATGVPATQVSATPMPTASSNVAGLFLAALKPPGIETTRLRTLPAPAVRRGLHPERLLAPLRLHRALAGGQGP